MLFPAHSAVQVLAPVLALVRSDAVSGPLTAHALQALLAWVRHGVVGMHAPLAREALRSLVAAVAHCRFEATDHESDEVVLARILAVLRAAVESEGGPSIGPRLLYEAMQTCYKMSLQGRLSLLLRRHAEATLLALVQTLWLADLSGAVAPDEGRFSLSAQLFLTL